LGWGGILALLVTSVGATYATNPFHWATSTSVTLTDIPSAYKIEIENKVANEYVGLSIAKDGCDVNADGIDDLIIYSQ
jgi:hypothetical protein